MVVSSLASHRRQHLSALEEVELVRRFDEALEHDRVLEAVDLLAERNRRARDPRWERQLIDLRHQAFAAVDHDQPPGEWPTRAFSPTSVEQGPDGLATVDRDHFGVEALGAGIRGHGCLHVPGLLDEAQVARLRHGIVAAWASRERFDGSEEEQPDEWYAPFKPAPPHRIGPKRVWAKDTGGLLAFDAPAVLFDLLETLTDLGVVDAIEDYLGERPALSFNKCTLREVDTDTNTDWHQDGAFLGAEIRTVNAWIALTECGIDAPGLDIVPHRIDDILTTGSGGAYFDWSIGDDVVRHRAGDAGIVRPVFRPGDVLLFDQYLVHRTAVDPGMTRRRHAIESWFFAPSAYPADKIPLVV